jgi:hypothetical protein
LFITPGTVKVHLTHIYAKTGITTRSCAAPPHPFAATGYPLTPPTDNLYATAQAIGTGIKPPRVSDRESAALTVCSRNVLIRPE